MLHRFGMLQDMTFVSNNVKRSVIFFFLSKESVFLLLLVQGNLVEMRQYVKLRVWKVWTCRNNNNSLESFYDYWQFNTSKKMCWFLHSAKGVLTERPDWILSQASLVPFIHRAPSGSTGICFCYTICLSSCTQNQPQTASSQLLPKCCLVCFIFTHSRSPSWTSSVLTCKPSHFTQG